MVQITSPYRDITKIKFTNFNHTTWTVVNAFGQMPEGWFTGYTPSATKYHQPDADNNMVHYYNDTESNYFRIDNAQTLVAGKLYLIIYEIKDIIDNSGAIALEQSNYISGDGEDYGAITGLDISSEGIKRVVVRMTDEDLVIRRRISGSYHFTMRFIAIKEYQGDNEINLGGGGSIVTN